MGFEIDKYLEKAKKGERLEELAIKLLCMKIKEIFSEEENVKKI
jgi:serine/threonine-protein phosphatase PPG1